MKASKIHQIVAAVRPSIQPLEAGDITPHIWVRDDNEPELHARNPYLRRDAMKNGSLVLGYFQLEKTIRSTANEKKIVGGRAGALIMTQLSETPVPGQFQILLSRDNWYRHTEYYDTIDVTETSEMMDPEIDEKEFIISAVAGTLYREVERPSDTTSL